MNTHIYTAHAHTHTCTHTHMHANILVASKAVLYLRFSVLLLEAPMSMLFARAWEGERGKR